MNAVLNEGRGLANYGISVIASGIPPLSSQSDPVVKTRGIMFGGEFSIGVSFGGSILVMFEEENWDILSWSSENCKVFVGGELGLGAGFDPAQPTVPALTWSTASIGGVAGVSLNTSGDFPGFIGGISVSSGCSVTGFASITGTPGATISTTGGVAVEAEDIGIPFTDFNLGGLNELCDPVKLLGAVAGGFSPID